MNVAVRFPADTGAPVLIHAIPGRLRYRLRLLKDPRANLGMIQILLEAIAGVESVRINRAAASIVIDHDGSGDVQASVERVLASIGGRTAMTASASVATHSVADMTPLIANAALLVLKGSAFVNQSALTGESEPVRKEVMDRVISGTTVEDGRLTIEARHVGSDTTTARVAQFIESALEETSDTQRVSAELADKRVYLTVGTGALVYALTRNVTRLESVLLVDYSCAIKLGTPLAFKAGMYSAAAGGLLVKGGQAIERLAAVDTIVFDKTGTLTYSELDVTDVVVLDQRHWTRERLLAMTASIEEHAHHPVAEAIVRKAREEAFKHIDHGEVDYLVAHGMSCPVEDAGFIRIGSRHYLEDHEDISFAAHEETVERLHEEGKTLLYVAANGQPLGVIALQDKVRENAAGEIQRLRDLGMKRIVMLTGDNPVKAHAIAAELGITEVHAAMEPEGKATVIEDLQRRGHKVAFVGDGVNDGPALVMADVGISMPRGAEIARASADVVLLEDRLGLIASGLDVSRRTMGLVDLNFKLAAGINSGVLLGAVTGFLSPLATAILHNGTTVGILLNALRGVKSNCPDPILSEGDTALSDERANRKRTSS